MKLESALKKGIALMGLIAIVAALIGVTPAAIQAAPLAQSANLLNAGFEAFAASGKAESWKIWYENTGKPAGDASAGNYALRPDYAPELNKALIHGGSYAQHVGDKYEPWHAGLYQVVGGFTPGDQVTFCYFGQLFANNTDYGKAPSINSKGQMQAGIYPDNLTDWSNGGIAWSPVYKPHGAYQQICAGPVTVAASGQVTVFTEAQYRGKDDLAFHLDAWFDDASLTVVAGGPTPEPTTGTTPNTAPTAAPVAPPPSVISTPNPDGSVVHVVQSGDTLFALSLAYNVQIDQIYSLNNLSSSSILSIGQKIIMKAGSGATAPTATTAPQAGTTPTAIATVQATAVPTTVAASTTAKLCVQAFNDANSDGIMVPSDSPVAGAQFAVATQQGVQVASFTTDGSTQPHCFADLQPGSYTVAVQPASGTVATSDKRWSVALTGGSTVNVNFGSRSDSSSGSSGNSSTQKSSSGSNLSGLLAGGIGLLALLVAGVLGAVIIARRRG